MILRDTDLDALRTQVEGVRGQVLDSMIAIRNATEAVAGLNDKLHSIQQLVQKVQATPVQQVAPEQAPQAPAA